MPGVGLKPGTFLLSSLLSLTRTMIDVGRSDLLGLLFIRQRVGRQIDDVAGDHRRDALVQRRQPHHRRLSVLDAVDVLRPQSRLDDQFVLQRQQLHDVLAGFDHAAPRMIAQLHHDAAHRRRDADPIEDALGAQHPLADVGQFAADLVHLLDRGLDRGLAHAVDLLERAGDPFLGIADVAHDAADLAFQIGLLPLQHHQFRLAHQPGLHQLVLGHDFLVEQNDLALDGIELHPRSLDPLLQRLDALLDALDVAVEVVAARRERHLLAVDDFLHLGRMRWPAN